MGFSWYFDGSPTNVAMNNNYFLKSFHDATLEPHGYLLIDLHQLTPVNMRLQTNV